MNYSEEETGSILTRLARAAIAAKLGLEFPPPDIAGLDWLKQQGASFVTLKKNGNLRGCIGSIEAYRPLVEDIQANAVAAALNDPRFPPLSADEFNDVDIEVSLLTQPEPLPTASEEEILALLQRQHPGVVLSLGRRRATFLPQVWEQLPDAQEFMAHLKMKAGLPPNYWHPDMQVSIYQVRKFSETDAATQE